MSEQTIHELKTWPAHFENVLSGIKTFEIRKADRPFKIGDVLILREWHPSLCQYTDRECSVIITHFILGGDFGIDPDYCVLSIRLIKEERTQEQAHPDCVDHGGEGCQRVKIKEAKP